MEKKELKMYETPAVEVVEMEVTQFLCGSVVGPGFDDEEESWG